MNEVARPIERPICFECCEPMQLKAIGVLIKAERRDVFWRADRWVCLDCGKQIYGAGTSWGYPGEAVQVADCGVDMTIKIRPEFV